MDLTIRTAVNADIPRLVALYRELELEQVAKKPIWALTDGLDERFELGFHHTIVDDESWLVVRSIDDPTAISRASATISSDTSSPRGVATVMSTPARAHPWIRLCATLFPAPK